MYLTRKQRNTLKVAASEGIRAINKHVSRLRTENPGAFHSADSLCGRVFYHKPLRGEPCLAFLRSAAHCYPSQGRAAARGSAERQSSYSTVIQDVEVQLG